MTDARTALSNAHAELISLAAGGDRIAARASFVLYELLNAVATGDAAAMREFVLTATHHHSGNSLAGAPPRVQASTLLAVTREQLSLAAAHERVARLSLVLAIYLRNAFPAIILRFTHADAISAVRTALAFEPTLERTTFDDLDAERVVLIAARALGVPKRAREKVFKAREMRQRPRRDQHAEASQPVPHAAPQQAAGTR